MKELKVYITIKETDTDYVVEVSKGGEVLRRSFFGDSIDFAMITSRAMVNVLEALKIKYEYNSELT